MVVDLYLYNPHEIGVWEPLWRALRRRGAAASFVLAPPGVHTAMGSRPDAASGWRDDKDRGWVPLMTAELHAETEALLRERRLPWLARGRYAAADAVVTTQGVGWLWRYRGLKLKTAYGAAANREVYGNGPMNRGLDGVFVHGEEGREKIARYVDPEDVVVAGYPRFAGLLRGEVDAAAWRRRLGLDGSRPVVAYLSTWAHNSSIDRYGAALRALGAEVDLLFKPHHNNLHFERERLEDLARSPYVRVISEIRDIVPVLAVADAVVADVRSGALTEACLAGRPCVGLSARGDPAEDDLLPEAEGAFAVCRDPADLLPLVREALGPDHRAEGRRRLVRRLFADLRGRDDDATAEALLALVDRKRRDR